MIPAIESLLELQRIDNQIKQLKAEIAALPQHIAEIERRLGAHQRKLAADQAALAANQRERKKLEDDIKVQEQKISKLRDQMLSAKTNEQYRAFLNEIAFCEAEIRKAEDRILELMEASDPLEKNVKAAQQALEAERREVEQEKAAAREKTTEDERRLAELETRRRTVVEALDRSLYQAYERLRKRWGDLVVADGTEGRCSACQIALRPQYFQDLKKAQQVQYCESCGRFLYYNPPVSFEHELHAAPSKP